MTGKPAISSPGRWRLLVGFAILPVIEAAIAFLAFPVVWWLGGHGGGRPVDGNQAAGAFALLTGILGLLVTVAGAVPVVISLMRRGRTSLRTFLIAGLILGNAPFVVFVVGLVVPLSFAHLMAGTMSQHMATVPELLAGTARALIIGSAFGLMSSAVFWLVAFAGAGRASAAEPHGFIRH